jgi:hypothetical protein
MELTGRFQFTLVLYRDCYLAQTFQPSPYWPFWASKSLVGKVTNL